MGSRRSRPRRPGTPAHCPQDTEVSAGGGPGVGSSVVDPAPRRLVAACGGLARMPTCRPRSCSCPSPFTPSLGAQGPCCWNSQGCRARALERFPPKQSQVRGDNPRVARALQGRGPGPLGGDPARAWEASTPARGPPARSHLAGWPCWPRSPQAGRAGQVGRRTGTLPRGAPRPPRLPPPPTGTSCQVRPARHTYLSSATPSSRVWEEVADG